MESVFYAPYNVFAAKTAAAAEDAGENYSANYPLFALLFVSQRSPFLSKS